MSGERILVVDDEQSIVDLVRFNLEEEGYDVDVALDGNTALQRAAKNDYTLVILDLMLPGIDGLEVCRVLRRNREQGPAIIMLTARDTAMDRITGLEMGADDYVTKPFHPRELVARVRAVLRRAGADPDAHIFEKDGLKLDPRAHRVTLDDEEVDLSATEFRLLETLMREPGRAFTRRQLLDLAWGTDYVGSERAVDVYIRYLRQKLDEHAGRTFIETVRGVGYRLRE